MPEQLGFEKRFGDPGAIDGDEFLLSAQRVGVDMTRDHVLADFAFARDQDFRVAARGALGEFQELAHRGLTIIGAAARLPAVLGSFDGLCMSGFIRCRAAARTSRTQQIAGPRENET